MRIDGLNLKFGCCKLPLLLTYPGRASECVHEQMTAEIAHTFAKHRGLEAVKTHTGIFFVRYYHRCMELPGAIS